MALGRGETAARLEARFGERVQPAVSREGPGARMVAGREHLLPVLDFLKNDPELAFDVLTDLTAVDYLHLDPPELEGARFAVVYQLDSLVHRHRFTVTARVPENDLIVPSATGLWPSALWAEREVLDLFGIEFDDHPDPRRLLLPEEYPGYPLRKDEPTRGSARRVAFLPSWRATALSLRPPAAISRATKITLPYPALDDTVAIHVDLAGDRVRTADVEVGFHHRGLEKRLEGAAYDDGVAIAGRVHEGRSRPHAAPVGALGYAIACEDLLEVVPPERAQALRVILAELTRLVEHLGTLRLVARAAGAEDLSGHLAERCRVVARALRHIAGDIGEGPLFRIGGLRGDISESALGSLAGLLEDFPEFLIRLVEGSVIGKLFAVRLRGAGRVTRDEAAAHGLTGPSLRASGVDRDLRRARPYCGYERFDFTVPIQEGGDCWSRFVQRALECRQSLRIIAQARDGLRPGAVGLEADGATTAAPAEAEAGGADSLGSALAGREVYSAIEAPAGELGHFLVAADASRPQRVGVRAPSFYHAAALSAILAGERLADVPLIVASFGLIPGEIDR